MSPQPAPGIHAALFDLDGTLVDSLPTIASAFIEALALWGLHAEPQQIIPLIGAPMNLLVEQIYDVPGDIADLVNADYIRIYRESYISRTPTNPGADELLRGLLATGMRLAVVTNKNDEGARRMVAIQAWEDVFEVVSGRDSGAPKPDPAAILIPLERLGVPVQESAFVGDTEFDMNCARDAGVPIVIGLVGSRTAEDLREDGATHIVHHLSEVAPILRPLGHPLSVEASS